MSRPTAARADKPVERVFRSPNEVARRIGVAEALVNEALRLGELEAVKLGRRTLIPVEAEARWLAGLPKFKA